MKTAKAFAPAAISSFFEICDTTADGKPITDLEKVGARGGGFGLQKGVSTKLTLCEAKTNSIKVFINSKPAPEAQTTLGVVKALLGLTDKKYDVTVDHKVEVPIGMGFGTSAGGALTAGLALKEALALHLTYNQIGKIAHTAEIKCQTGLGTVSSLTFTGGCVLVLEPGAPGICVIDRIPLPLDYSVVAGFFSPASKKALFSNAQRRGEINRWGKKTLEAIMADPSVENFLASCWEFSEKTGFATDNTRKLVKLAKNAGAVGAAQNMVGEAVHAFVPKENVNLVAEAFKGVLPRENIIVSEIDFQGARLVADEEVQKGSSRRNIR